MRGGKRKGAGRPKGSTKEQSDWEPITTRVSPESKRWLEKQKMAGHTIAKLVDRAIKELMQD